MVAAAEPAITHPLAPISHRSAVLPALAAFCAVLLASCGGRDNATPAPTGTQSPATSTPAPSTAAATPGLGSPQFESARALQHDHVLSVDIGIRAAGTDGEKRAANYIRDELAKYGYDASLQPFPIQTFVDVKTALDLLSPQQRPVDAAALGGSTSGTIESSLVSAGRGFPQEFPAGTSGSVVLIERGDNTFSEKAANATAAGAAGVIIYNNDSGFSNTANGVAALYGNTTGNNSTADGVNALHNNTTGNNNIALGINAGQNLSIGDNNIDIGNVGVGAEANTIRIGTQGTQTTTYVAGISGSPVARGVAVVVDAAVHLGIKTSSARFKDEIKPMDKASEAILALKPVTFRYKKEIDPEATPQFGLVAEDVEKVNPDLVVRNPNGKPYTVRYDAVNAMLLNEFLKEHRKVQDLEANAGRQQKQIDALTAGLQKVSAQLELTKSAPQTVVNNQ